MPVEVFKTNVSDGQNAQELLIFLNSRLPITRINFDLDDRDRILRVESASDISGEIRKMMSEKGFFCEELSG
jgi:hypothetical protein